MPSKPEPHAPAKIPLYSTQYFSVCALGGALACGVSHTLFVPLDLVKTNIQANPSLFKGIGQGFGLMGRRVGLRGLYTGWAPTAVGYTVQGFFKYGLYELFKYKYASTWRGHFGDESVNKYRDLIYISASASAEFFADIGLCAFESTRVRLQTTLDPVTLRPTAGRGLFDGMRNIVKSEGTNGLFKGLRPLWFRQIPYTIVKFVGFERAVEMIYGLLPKKKHEYNKYQQLSVSFAGGYLAGIFCAIISHPADTMVSMLNQNKSATISSVWRDTPKMTLMTKGLGARILMIGTLTGLQWFLYDTYKQMSGLEISHGLAKH